MDIYSRKSRWKLYLAIGGFLIVLITIFYSKYLADRLAENERNNVELFAETLRSANQTNQLASDAGLELMILEKLNNIPVILENEEGKLTGNNYGDSKNNDAEFLEGRKAQILKSGYEPIEGIGYARFIYYENSRLYKLITYFPLVQFLLLGAFIGLGYIGFSSSRKAEQNRVWAGMAKETAHQLGTPISAIIAWIEHLKELSVGDDQKEEIIMELRSDVTRLELIADRFSKIGSAPKLEPVNVYTQLDSSKRYMQRRASQRIEFDFPDTNQTLNININRHLFDWVIENILRNALDAMEGEGRIKVTVEEDEQYASIDIEDTGSGIPASKFKTVFNPGFSTKKRGWGLGLSLAKRIIEDYHKGKIFVKSSKLEEGTIFTLKIPRSKR